jgi:hypothetical protein
MNHVMLCYVMVCYTIELWNFMGIIGQHNVGTLTQYKLYRLSWCKLYAQQELAIPCEFSCSTTWHCTVDSKAALQLVLDTNCSRCQAQALLAVINDRQKHALLNIGWHPHRASRLIKGICIWLWLSSDMLLPLISTSSGTTSHSCQVTLWGALGKLYAAMRNKS